jgi:DNA processing protein
MTVSREERAARAALTRVAEPDDAGIRRAVDRLGPEEVWSRVRAGATEIDGGAVAAAAARARTCDPDADLARAARSSARLVCPGDEEWPERLADLDGYRLGGAPYALWVRGTTSLAELTVRSVAVVGARAATAYGQRIAGDLAAGVAARGWTVVSGGAYGIDGAAHRGALAVDAPTVVVLAGGVDVVYPTAHCNLFAAAAEGGAVVSEAPPGAAAMRHRFLTRNRLIAALSRGTVIVEAAPRSGALNTAAHAERLLRPTMAVPGPVGSALSAGSHVLLRDRGAVLVTCADDVLEVVGDVGETLAPVVRGVGRSRDTLSPEAARVLDAVPVLRAAVTARIAVAAGVDPREAITRLGELAARGFVERGPEGWRLSAGERAARRGPGP